LAAYLIYQADVIDNEGYETYRAAVRPSVVAGGGKYLVRGGECVVLEGELPAGRTVVIEFASREAALEWYRGEEYTEIRKLRDGIVRANLYVVDGVA
jgi:uncharacterized protein (DUF1330 family)